MALELDHGYEDKRASLNLASSESAVFAAASRIFAAYIQVGKVNGKNDNEVMNLALKQAIHLALKADTNIKSDNEI